MSWPFAMLLVAIGGCAATVGVALGWWDARAVRTTEIFGREIVDERFLAGWNAWPGVLALASGLAAVAIAAIGARSGPARPGGLCALSLACGLLVAAGAALAGVAGVAAAERALAGVGDTVEVSPAGGSVLSGLGGLLVLVGGGAGLIGRRASRAPGL